MCHDSFSKILAFIGSFVVGIILAVLYNNGTIVDLTGLLYVGLVLVAICLVTALWLVIGRHRAGDCICQYAASIVYSSAIAAVLGGILRSMNITSISVPTAVVYGVWVTLTLFALCLLCLYVGCVIQEKCGCEYDCGCGRSSCRCGREENRYHAGDSCGCTVDSRSCAGDSCPIDGRPSRFS